MNILPIAAPPPGLNLGDVYFTLFRHKWRIAVCTLLGIAAAAVVNKIMAPPYQSEAKLFVRYIISENRGLGPTTTDSVAKSPDQRGETIMKSESEILTSLDVAKQVAETIGPEKILRLSGGGKDSAAAAALIKDNLVVYVAPASSVIDITFSNPDPEVVQPVLREVIERYRQLHVAIHSSNGMVGDYLTQETDQLRARLSQTEDDLRKASLKAGIVSLEDAKKANSDQLMGLRRELFQAQADLAERGAILDELNKRFPTASSASAQESSIPADVATEYKSVVRQVDALEKMEQETLMQFTPESARVTEVRTLLKAAREARSGLERAHPKLLIADIASHGPDGGTLNPAVVGTQIIALQARLKMLTGQLAEVQHDESKVDQMEGTIVELRRKKELEDTNYRYYSASLEQSRIDETLGNGRVSNISQIQSPSPPSSDRSKSNKLVGMILGGGLVGGVAWAFLIELYFDRTVKRPVDLDRTLRVPLLLAIPKLARKQIRGGGSATLRLTNDESETPINGGASYALQAFHETLRDRLISFFESVNLTHKPKLVAVTSLGHKAGVSTSATGLARSLSETGEGNVLLVDMNAGPGIAQQFLRGKEVSGLDQFLDARDGGDDGQKLYVVAENNNGDQLSRNIPRRFSKLLPKLKASDFDYIIFDMPPISQISITPRLAGFMDMVLLVVEAEKTDRELVQRATSLLAETKVHLAVVLNKTRSYVPAGLYQDNLGSV